MHTSPRPRETAQWAQLQGGHRLYAGWCLHQSIYMLAGVCTSLSICWLVSAPVYLYAGWCLHQSIYMPAGVGTSLSTCICWLASAPVYLYAGCTSLSICWLVSAPVYLYAGCCLHQSIYMLAGVCTSLSICWLASAPVYLYAGCCLHQSIYMLAGVCTTLSICWLVSAPVYLYAGWRLHQSIYMLAGVCTSLSICWLLSAPVYLYAGCCLHQSIYMLAGVCTTLSICWLVSAPVYLYAGCCLHQSIYMLAAVCTNLSICWLLSAPVYLYAGAYRVSCLVVPPETWRKIGHLHLCTINLHLYTNRKLHSTLTTMLHGGLSHKQQAKLQTLYTHTYIHTQVAESGELVLLTALPVFYPCASYSTVDMHWWPGIASNNGSLKKNGEVVQLLLDDHTHTHTCGMLDMQLPKCTRLPITYIQHIQQPRFPSCAWCTKRHCTTNSRKGDNHKNNSCTTFTKIRRKRKIFMQIILTQI